MILKTFCPVKIHILRNSLLYSANSANKTLRAIKELINNPGVMINISRLEWYDNYRVTNTIIQFFTRPFISWPSKKLFSKHLFI